MATARFRCFWLTSRARTGWPDGIRRAFRAAGAVLDEPRWAILDLIESAPWDGAQMRSIDPKSDFWSDLRRDHPANGTRPGSGTPCLL
jgi:hypothetical protein